MGLPAKKIEKERLKKAAKYLYQLRFDSQFTQKQAAYHLGITDAYLSELENGKKTPSYFLIRDIAKLYEVDERILFKMFEKIPLGVIEELETNPTLQQTLTEIRYSDQLTDDQKQELYDLLYISYRKMLGEDS
jgi:transcriptional regulator with XRE-family HTH domain